MKEKIAVIGIGRVGLPLSLSFAAAGFSVYGIDINKDLIGKLNQGEMPFLEKGAGELLERHISKEFFPTEDSSIIKDCKYIIITLGTPVDEHLNPDYSQIESILPVLKDNIQKGQLLMLRSTVAPGTTEIIKSYLEKNTCLIAGIDFFLAFCPERIAAGNAIEEIKEVPQIIGSLDKKSSEMAKELFGNIAADCIISDAKSAELAKIFTNMYRYINFAIANEFAILAMEHKKDIHHILEISNRNYKRGQIPMPGFTSGPCLYKDGFFLLDAVPFNELISTSWRINENFPIYLLNRIKETVKLKDKKVALLGMAFKKNIDDPRNSLSYKLKKALQREHCHIALHDPYIAEHGGDIKEILLNADVVIIAINHDEYKALTKEFLREHASKGCIVCDVWNMEGKGKIIYHVND